MHVIFSYGSFVLTSPDSHATVLSSIPYLLLVQAETLRVVSSQARSDIFLVCWSPMVVHTPVETKI
jgi:hypothetical protein